MVKKRSALIILFLYVLVFSVGCSSLRELVGLQDQVKSEDGQKQSEKISPEQLEKEKNKEQEKFDGLERSLGEEKSKLKKLQNEYAQMREETKKRKKDPDDSKQAPKTVQKSQEVKETASKVKDIEEKVEASRKKLENIQNQINALQKTNETDESYKWGNTLLWFILGLVLLTVAGVAGFFTYQYISKLNNTIAYFDKEIKNIRSKHREHILEYKNKDNVRDGQYDQIQKQIKIVNENISSVSGQVAVQADFTSQHVSEPESKPEPKPEFPVSVENYVSKNAGNLLQKVTADSIKQILIQDPNKGDEFYIFSHSRLESDFGYAIPNQTRFVREDEYSYYQQYYDFDNPSGGTLWIRKPATVRQIEGGWRLHEKGKLEVR